MISYHKIGKKILQWYLENKRDLPWRNTNDPYKIWISEIMLQQTKVATVIPYYLRFLTRFPTNKSLAAASLEEVYKYWEGLGYYRRAKHLYRAACKIESDFEGKIPANENDILSLPGIGQYSSASILSIAFDVNLPVLDGNVKRILARLFGISDEVSLKLFHQKAFSFAKKMMQPNNPSEFNQAMMELGALICTPKIPQCSKCPCQKNCFAFQNGKSGELPYKKKKKKIPIKKQYIFITLQAQKCWLTKRKPKILLENLWEFPRIEARNQTEAKKWIENQFLIHKKIRKLFHYEFLFTHQKWRIQVFLVFAQECISKDTFVLFHNDEIEKLPIPTVFQPIKEIIQNEKFI